MQIKTFDDSLGRFFKGLEKQTIAKVLRTIDLLSEFGRDLKLPHSKSLGGNLFELRVSGKQSARVFYTFHKKAIVLLYGFVKKSSKIPQKEMKIAKQKQKALD